MCSKASKRHLFAQHIQSLELFLTGCSNFTWVCITTYQIHDIKYKNKKYILKFRTQLFVSGSSQATGFWVPAGYPAGV